MWQVQCWFMGNVSFRSFYREKMNSTWRGGGGSARLQSPKRQLRAADLGRTTTAKRQHTKNFICVSHTRDCFPQSHLLPWNYGTLDWRNRKVTTASPQHQAWWSLTIQERFQFHYLLLVGLWESYLTSMNLSFLPCEVGIFISAL